MQLEFSNEPVLKPGIGWNGFLRMSHFLWLVSCILVTGHQLHLVRYDGKVTHIGRTPVVHPLHHRGPLVPR